MQELSVWDGLYVVLYLSISLTQTMRYKNLRLLSDSFLDGIQGCENRFPGDKGSKNMKNKDKGRIGMVESFTSTRDNF